MFSQLGDSVPILKSEGALNVVTTFSCEGNAYRFVLPLSLFIQVITSFETDFGVGLRPLSRRMQDFMVDSIYYQPQKWKCPAAYASKLMSGHLPDVSEFNPELTWQEDESAFMLPTFTGSQRLAKLKPRVFVIFYKDKKETVFLQMSGTNKSGT